MEVCNTISSPVLLVLTIQLFNSLTSAFPTGAPLSACASLLPVHIGGELQETVTPYILILNSTEYDGKTPLKLTVTTVGPTVQNFMAFMLQARSEYGEVAGHFAQVPEATKAMTCYSTEDTLSHTAAFVRPQMEVLWYPPETNIGKIFITGSINVNKNHYWKVESEAVKGMGPLDPKVKKPGPTGGAVNSQGLTHLAMVPVLTTFTVLKFMNRS